MQQTPLIALLIIPVSSSHLDQFDFWGVFFGSRGDSESVLGLW